MGEAGARKRGGGKARRSGCPPPQRPATGSICTRGRGFARSPRMTPCRLNPGPSAPFTWAADLINFKGIQNDNYFNRSKIQPSDATDHT